MNTALKYDDFYVGRETVSPGRTITDADIQQFAGLSGDYNPLHTNEEFAKKTPFGRRIAHGALTFAISTGLGFQVGDTNGTAIAFYGTELQFTAPVFVGDTIHAVSKCVEKIDGKHPDRGLIVLEEQMVNQDGVVVMKQKAKVLVRR